MAANRDRCVGPHRSYAIIRDLTHEKLKDAKLEGADPRYARLDWADLSNADLSFANLAENHSFETTELAGIDYLFADLTGTFLDINQPPPERLSRNSL